MRFGSLAFLLFLTLAIGCGPYDSDGPEAGGDPSPAADDAAAVAALKDLGANLKEKEGRVVEVDLRNTTVKSEDFALLAKLPSLEVLTVSSPEFTDASLDTLTACQRIRVLDLDGCNQVTNAGIEHLKKFPNLETVGLEKVGIDNEGMGILSSIEQLKRIAVPRTNISDEGLAYLKDKKNLILLDLRHCPTVSSSGIAQLAGLTNMENFKIWGANITNEAMDTVGKFTKLKALHLEETTVNDDGIAKLSGLTNLEELNLFNAPVKGTGLAVCANMPRLRWIRARGTLLKNDSMPHLRPLAELKYLDLSETQVGDEGMQHLAGHGALEDLNLWNAFVSDAGCEHIATLKALKRLNLDALGLSDEAMRHVAELPGLEYLHVGSNNLSDEGLKHLHGLSQLQELIVTFNPGVTNDGVEQIKQAIPSLEHVEL